MSNTNLSNKSAFVTFLMLNDSYLPGALMLAYGLRKQETEVDLVCLITEEITHVWFKEYNKMLASYPELRKVNKLSKIKQMCDFISSKYGSLVNSGGMILV